MATRDGVPYGPPHNVRPIEGRATGVIEMKTIKLAAAMVMSTAMAGTAHAALITKSFETTLTYNDAPISKVVSTFDITFDPSLNSSNQTVAIANYKAANGSSYFDVSASLTYYPAMMDWDGTKTLSRQFFVLEGSNSGLDSAKSQYDFTTTIYVDSAGNPTIVENFQSGGYYLRGSNDFSGHSFAIRDITAVAGETPPITSAVPEPATWAMTLLGFGMVAGAARYRRRRASVSFA